MAGAAINFPELRISETDALTVDGKAGSAFILDGIMVLGRSVQVRGELASLTLRQCTLVPGWGLENDCRPRWPNLGSIYVTQDEVGTDPIPLRISDSVVDGTSEEEIAIGAVEAAVAHVRLTVQRSTVFGQVLVHAMELGENSVFEGVIRVARRGRARAATEPAPSGGRGRRAPAPATRRGPRGRGRPG